MTTTIKYLNLSIPLTKENVGEMIDANIETKDIQTLIKHGFFGFKSGSITIHRDRNGKLVGIEKKIREL